ncbi:MAG: DUF4239 domain-containing protein [Methylobacter sp.]|uniref:bestrophin-like domain n=1 Tax=Methylobacter sp. TaxID=2051955 RepID=UPI0025DAD3D5|nr:DUF4239 domain-containing protein [Methylobacter sp.]MCK9622296.1 DUF4239 domain-containing protein [Methylobacter sp.]
MILFLLKLPVIPMALLIIGTTVAVAWFLVEIVHRSPLAKLKPSFRHMLPTLGGSMMAGYVIFSALVANTVWREKEFAEQAVYQEMRSLSFADRMVDTQRYPELGLAIAAYAKAVALQEWQTMSDGIENAGARQILDDLHQAALTGLPGLSDEIRKSLVASLKEAEVARQNRLMAATDNMPGEVWLTVLLTALVVLSFSAFAHEHDRAAARIMATLFGVMIGSMMFCIIAVDRPFIGEVSISNAPIAKLWEHHR